MVLLFSLSLDFKPSFLPAHAYRGLFSPSIQRTFHLVTFTPKKAFTLLHAEVTAHVAGRKNNTLSHISFVVYNFLFSHVMRHMCHCKNKQCRRKKYAAE